MTNLIMWEDNNKLAEIKQVFGKNLTDVEFQTFCAIGKATGLNPFLREIWCIKYGQRNPASIFVGRDGYRTAARRHSDYISHYADAVYENDEFCVKNQTPEHSYSLKDRGKLVGAFCTVTTKSSEKPFFVYVDFNEYNKRQGNWITMPATMCKKVAESQCLRMAFPDMLAGTYDESEQWAPEREEKVINSTTSEEEEVMNLLMGDESSLETAKKKAEQLTDTMMSATTLDELKVYYGEVYRHVKSNLPDMLDYVDQMKEKMKEKLAA